MNQIIAASRSKCPKCGRPVAKIPLINSKGTALVDKEPSPDGQVGLVFPGLPGDKKRPPKGAMVSIGRRDEFDELYRIHACERAQAA